MEISEDLLERYFNNKVSPREARVVLRWFRTREGQRYLEGRLTADLDNLDERKLVLIQPLKTQEMLRAIYGATQEPVVPAGPSRAFYVKIAAGFVMAALVLGLFLLNRQHTVTYATKYGERREIVLPDSSRVVLNGNSSITLAGDWSHIEKREVWLQGEAFFNVFHTRQHNEFVVHAADNFNIRVLGTEFNVSSRQNTTRVALVHGNIQLNFLEKGEQVNLSMKPGELVEFDQRSACMIKKETKVKNISSWKEHHMLFEQASLSEIAEMLKNTYGIKLIVDDPTILDQKISGSVPNQSLDLFLRGLAEILEVKVIREEGLVYFETSVKANQN